MAPRSNTSTKTSAAQDDSNSAVSRAKRKYEHFLAKLDAHYDYERELRKKTEEARRNYDNAHLEERLKKALSESSGGAKKRRKQTDPSKPRLNLNAFHLQEMAKKRKAALEGGKSHPDFEDWKHT